MSEAERQNKLQSLDRPASVHFL